MFKIAWDKSNNGVILSDDIPEDKVIQAPRPVFYEELDLLGFDKHWIYPKSIEPLLWAVGRSYYYMGVEVAQLKGGDIYSLPIPEIFYPTINEPKNKLIPIDIEKLVSENSKSLKSLENQSIDFIQRTYKQFYKDVDIVAVSYSGGKDSQVVLDLVVKTLSIKEFQVIFTDTTMEYPFTYENIIETQEFYKRNHPEFIIHNAHPYRDSIEDWKIFGPPSRIHRWCCSVDKTAPFSRLLNSFVNQTNKKVPRSLVFVGVRKDESVNRAKYSRIARGVKHINQINAGVIHDWNTTEVFLYILQNKLPFNKGYRKGLSRVGCMVCPFNTSWTEALSGHLKIPEFSQYLNIIEDHVRMLGIQDDNKLKKYISEQQWMKRGGGEGVDQKGTSVTFTEIGNNLIVLVQKPRENILEYMKILGNLHTVLMDNGIKGEVLFRGISIQFYCIEKNGSIRIEFPNINNLLEAKRAIKKVIQKAAYCSNCGVCELECTHSALITYPKVQVLQNCKHCLACLNVSSKGCLVADSLTISTGGKKMSKELDGFGKYQDFGMREHWLSSFLQNPDYYFTEANGLGPNQILSFKAWLRDCELLQDNNVTELTKIFVQYYKNHFEIVMQICLINLSFNSPVFLWTVKNLTWGSHNTVKDILDQITNQYEVNLTRKIDSGVKSLFNTIECFDIAKEFGIMHIAGNKNNRTLVKTGSDNIHPIAILYCLYKLREATGKSAYTINELYDRNDLITPNKVFGISRTSFINIVKSLHNTIHHLIRVDIVADLDNVFISEGLDSINILVDPQVLELM
ncbi:MAG: phosphoadenosine phosphosulfate reductase family protein [Candidatus Cloacimonas sp.]